MQKSDNYTMPHGMEKMTTFSYFCDFFFIHYGKWNASKVEIGFVIYIKKEF